MLEELVYVPPLHAGFFLTDAKMRGCSNAEALAAVREKFWPALIAGWVFWRTSRRTQTLDIAAASQSLRSRPCAASAAMDVVTFCGVVPPKYRMLWVGVCQIGWSAYVSALAARPSEAPVAPRLSGRVTARIGRPSGGTRREE
jgi:hypothetical protein